jgi:hypothetical protein
MLGVRVSLLFNLFVSDGEVVLTSSTISEGVTSIYLIITLCEAWESLFCVKFRHAYFACTSLLLRSTNHVSRDAGLGNVTLSESNKISSIEGYSLDYFVLSHNQ